MQFTNIRGHRIRWSHQAMRGALVGLISAVVMLAIATVTYPMAVAAADGWSFLKVASGAVLGSGAAEPLSGFETTPVLVGLIVHFALGLVAGVTYSLLVALFALEGWTPVALFGLIYGAMLFVWGTVLVEAGIAPTTSEQFPVMAMFLGNMAFGLTAGVLLATWADESDLDQEIEERVPVFESDPPNSHRMLH